MPLPIGYDELPEEKPTHWGSSVDRAQANAYKGLASMATDAGQAKAAKWLGTQGQVNQIAADQYQIKGSQRFSDAQKAGDYGTWAKNTFIQTLPQMGASIAATAAGTIVAGPLVGASMGAAVSAPALHNENVQRQEQTGKGTLKDRYIATGVNTALELATPLAFVNKFRKAGAMGRATLKGEIAKGTIREGTTESGQGAVTDWQAGINPNMGDEYLRDRMDEAAAGAIIGGPIQGVGHVASYPSRALENTQGVVERTRNNLEARAQQYQQDSEDYGMFGSGRPKINMSEEVTESDFTQRLRMINEGEADSFSDKQTEFLNQFPIEDRDAFIDGIQGNLQGVSAANLNDPAPDNTYESNEFEDYGPEYGSSVVERNNLNEESIKEPDQLTGSFTRKPRYIVMAQNSGKNKDESKTKRTGWEDPVANLWYDKDFAETMGIADNKNFNKSYAKHDIDKFIIGMENDKFDYAKVPLSEVLEDSGKDPRQFANDIIKNVNSPGKRAALTVEAKKLGLSGFLEKFHSVKETPKPEGSIANVEQITPAQLRGTGPRRGLITKANYTEDAVKRTTEENGYVQLPDGDVFNMVSATKMRMTDIDSKWNTRSQAEQQKLGRNATSSLLAELSDSNSNFSLPVLSNAASMKKIMDLKRSQGKEISRKEMNQYAKAQREANEFMTITPVAMNRNSYLKDAEGNILKDRNGKKRTYVSYKSLREMMAVNGFEANEAAIARIKEHNLRMEDQDEAANTALENAQNQGREDHSNSIMHGMNMRNQIARTNEIELIQRENIRDVLRTDPEVWPDEVLDKDLQTFSGEETDLTDYNEQAVLEGDTLSDYEGAEQDSMSDPRNADTKELITKGMILGPKPVGTSKMAFNKVQAENPGSKPFLITKDNVGAYKIPKDVFAKLEYPIEQDTWMNKRLDGSYALQSFDTPINVKDYQDAYKSQVREVKAESGPKSPIKSVGSKLDAYIEERSAILNRIVNNATEFSGIKDLQKRINKSSNSKSIQNKYDRIMEQFHKTSEYKKDRIRLDNANKLISEMQAKGRKPNQAAQQELGLENTMPIDKDAEDLAVLERLYKNATPNVIPKRLQELRQAKEKTSLEVVGTFEKDNVEDQTELDFDGKPVQQELELESKSGTREPYQRIEEGNYVKDNSKNQMELKFSTTPEAASKRYKRETEKYVRDDDTLLEAVSRFGWKTEDAVADGADPADHGLRGIGINRVMRKTGLSTGELFRLMTEEGSPFRFTDDNEMVEAIVDNMNNPTKKVYGDQDVDDVVDQAQQDYYDQQEQSEQAQNEFESDSASRFTDKDRRYVNSLQTKSEIEAAGKRAKTQGLDRIAQELRKKYAKAIKSKSKMTKNEKIHIAPKGKDINDVNEIVNTMDSPTYTPETARKQIWNKQRKLKGNNTKEFEDALKQEIEVLTKAVHDQGEYTYAEINQQRKGDFKTQELADRVLKGTGISVSVISNDRASEIANELNITDYSRKVAEGTIHAFTNSVPTKDGQYEIFINDKITGKTRDEILTHELGHSIFNSAWNNASDSTISKVNAEYTRWLKTHGRDDASYKKLIESKKSPKAALLYLQNLANNKSVGELSPESKEYVTDFEEWFADTASKHLNSKQRVKANTVAALFHYITTRLKRLVGKDNVGAFIDGLKDNSKSIAPRDPGVKFSQNLTGTPEIKSAMGKFLDVALDKDSRLRSMAKAAKIPSFIRLADMMHKKIGDQISDNSYWGARLRETGRYETRWGDILSKIPENEQANVLKELYSDKKSVSAHTRRVRKLLSDMADYMEKAGVEVNRRKNYFPQIINTEYLQNNQIEFETMMAKYPKAMKSLADTRTKQSAIEYLSMRGQPIDETSIDLTIKSGKVDTIDPADMPRHLYNQLVEGQGVTDREIVGQQTPGNRFLNTRIFDFMTGKDDVNWTENFLQQNLNDAMVPYLSSAVKRTEFERRFNKEALFNLFQKARDEGATDAQLQQAHDNVSAEMGTHGRRTAQWLSDQFSGLSMPKERSPINPKLQTVQNTMITASNALVLGLSAITSIVDPVGIAVRTGELNIAVKAMRDGIKASFNKVADKKGLNRLAEELGAIGNDSVKEALQHGYSSAYMTPKFKKFNDSMFKVFGLESWTRTTRLMGASAARQFLEKHSKGNTELSQRYMDELGLKNGDLKGGANLLSYGDYQKADAKEQARDDRVRSAMAEFIDTAILRPSPSQRPLYASDPHWAWFFHLKSFQYSFQKTILNRIGHEVTQDNFAPLMMASLYLPIALMGQQMKDVIKTLGDDEDDWTPTNKEGWGFFNHLEDSVNKSGLYGIMQPIRDAATNAKYNNSVLLGLAGPSVDPGTYSQLPIPLNYIWNNISK